MTNRFGSPSWLVALALLGCSAETSSNSLGTAVDAQQPRTDGPNAAPTGPIVYLSQQGNDGNDGKSAAAPKRTWDAAIDAAGPGGTVYLSGRYYDERIVIHASGVTGNPVTLKPDPANRGFIDGGQSNPRGTWREDNLVRIWGHDIIWDGIEIFNSPWNAFGFDGTAHRGIMRNTKIHDVYMQPAGTAADDTIFEDNQIYDSELSNANGALLEGVAGTGIGTGWNWNEERRVRRFTARRNKIWNNWGENISAFHCDGFAIYDNDISPPTAVGIYTDNASDGVVERNYIHHGRGRAFAFSSEPYGYTTHRDPPHDITWRNNVIHDTDVVAFIRDGRKTYYNLRFLGNTFHNTGFYADRADEGGVRGNEFIGNLVDGDFHLADMQGWDIHHNAWPRGNAQGSNPVTAPPQYVDPAAGTPDGLRIAVSSPLRGAGAAHASLTNDYFNGTRPSPPSIGAHEPQ